jgi:adenylosuccinate synthase
VLASFLAVSFGDEGKGKLVDYLIQRNVDVCTRFNGGNNAGHSIQIGARSYHVHLLPSGILTPSCVNVIGNGVVVHIAALVAELASIELTPHSAVGRLLISDRAHVVFDFHQVVDGLVEAALGDKKLGTTKRGIGPAYADKAARRGLRIADVLDDSFAPRFLALVASVRREWGAALAASHYDPRRRARQPPRPSRSHSPSRHRHWRLSRRRCRRRQVRPRRGRQRRHARHRPRHLSLRHLLQHHRRRRRHRQRHGPVAVRPCARHHQGLHHPGRLRPLSHRELFDATGAHLAKASATSSAPPPVAPRRCGWLDLNIVGYAHRLNGFTAINITKLDILSGISELKLGVAYTLDGKPLPFGSMPARLDDLARCEVVYETFPGWTEDISACTRVADLPAAAQAYLARIEQVLGVRAKWIGVGAGRDQTIVVD